jgi:hypothetical protein
MGDQEEEDEFEGHSVDVAKWRDTTYMQPFICRTTPRSEVYSWLIFVLLYNSQDQTVIMVYLAVATSLWG